ncbi:unnamed protein product [Rhizoctonia solani]|uniref:Uncharacterized protein n=1 Tax=Rhizoctonia solani TaxID=456999 RepID=A0A8H3DVH6_9AGAM|nr:unnamed protein product [Rhizoctonia solani]
MAATLPHPPRPEVSFGDGSPSFLPSTFDISGDTGGQGQSLDALATIRMTVPQDLYANASPQAIKTFVKEFKQAIGKGLKQVECSFATSSITSKSNVSGVTFVPRDLRLKIKQ